MSWTTLLIHWMASGAAVFVTGVIVPGVRVKSFKAALVAAVLIGAGNQFLWPILLVLTLPLTIVTFGLFLWVLDAMIIRLCAAMMTDFQVRGWLSAMGASVVLALTGGFLHWFLA